MASYYELAQQGHKTLPWWLYNTLPMINLYVRH